MKLYLHGHDYKYAAEQMLLTLFPAQRPEYPAGPPAPGEDALVLSLHRGTVWATATAALSCGGREYRAARRCRTAELTDPLSTDRALQRILKLAFYDAGTAARGGEPPWGALTGVRPVKIPTKAMLAGASPAQAERLLRDTYRVTEGRRRLAMDCAGASLAALRSLAPGEVSLYVGIPFCPTTCLYCSFTSFPIGKWEGKTKLYLDALFREMDYVAEKMKGRPLDTVYFGGGTPTSLNPGALDALRCKVEAAFLTDKVREFTVEAGRPDSITQEKLEVLRKHGITRISINPQTMNQKTLDLIGRHHTVDMVKDRFYMARELGFDNINMDLIMGLPEENMDDVRLTLEEVKALAPDSLTVHSLAIKRAARLNMFREEYGGLKIQNTPEMIELSAACARQMGMEPYYLYRQKNMAGNFENVGYSLPGKACIYNILIMEEMQTIAACGAGTTTKVVFPSENRRERCENVKEVEQYISRIDEMIQRKERIL